jgi:two-component system response regulator GlrR
MLEPGSAVKDKHLTTMPLRSPQRDHVDVVRFRLAVDDGPDRGASLTSEGERVVIGTAEGADLRLTDRSVSRFHCEIALTADAIVISDLQSRNGTTVDTVPVQRAPLRDGATIGVGTTRIAFRLGTELAAIPLATDERFGRMIGKATATRAVMAQLARAAQTDSTVLLEGETGTGKEIASESLHLASGRKDKPFLVVDCGAMPADLLESELFGHERGAFTGANERRIGVFEAANGGTVLLDEIGELALELQPKLLRVLEKREIKRIGANIYQPLDVRIVAATNRDLRAEVNGQRFRSDLYYRLAVVQVRLPPLRERTEDLPLLVDAILDELGLADHPVSATLRTADARAQLAAHAWPGNIRELRNYIERCVAMRATMPPGGEPAAVPSAPHGLEPFKTARDRSVRLFEHAYLTDLLAREGGNVTAAARAAGVDRIYLYRLLWRHGLK